MPTASSSLPMGGCVKSAAMPSCWRAAASTANSTTNSSVRWRRCGARRREANAGRRSAAPLTPACERGRYTARPGSEPHAKEDTRMTRFAENSGVRIAYEMHGQGEPVLLIMGFGAPRQAWIAQIPALAERFQVIALDNRNAGESDVT